MYNAPRRITVLRLVECQCAHCLAWAQARRVTPAGQTRSTGRVNSNADNPRDTFSFHATRLAGRSLKGRQKVGVRVALSGHRPRPPVFKNRGAFACIPGFNPLFGRLFSWLLQPSVPVRQALFRRSSRRRPHFRGRAGPVLFPGSPCPRCSSGTGPPAAAR